MNVVLDSTLLIDCLNRVPAAVTELKTHPEASISIMSWIEVMAGARTSSEAVKIKRFLEEFECLPLDNEVAEQASILRRQRRLKLPDAVILATAQVHHAILLTRNTRDFPEKTPGVRIPYRM